jgi:hypothetical protein
MIASSLQEVGAARSIVIDEDGNILAGNGTIEAAAQAGIERVRVVESDGNEIIAVQRSGLSSKEKKRLALFDNRTAELAEWEPSILAEDKDILDGLFSTQELRRRHHDGSSRADGRTCYGNGDRAQVRSGRPGAHGGDGPGAEVGQ